LHLLNPDIARASASRDFAEAADSVRGWPGFLAGAFRTGSEENAAMGSGCQWAAKDYDGDMMVQVVPASYHEEPKLAKSFQAMPGLGSPAASQQTAVALLKEVLSRRK
jgi:hypothetical protein